MPAESSPLASRASTFTPAIVARVVAICGGAASCAGRNLQTQLVSFTTRLPEFVLQLANNR